MERCLLALIALALAAPSGAEPLTLDATLPGAQAVGIHARIARIQGKLGPPGAAPERAIDSADYSKAGTLSVGGPVMLGSSPAPLVFVPAGTYSLSLMPTAEGTPSLRLHGEDGSRVQIPLLTAGGRTTRPSALEAEGLPAGDLASWTLVFHLPTVSGALRFEAAPPPGAAGALAQATEAAAPAAPPAGVTPDPAAADLEEKPPAVPGRRQSRSERIRERVDQRERSRTAPRTPK